jgi:BirA family biotin operon repressor/biotin-[acetyl-CoA-carboxylase] ligase
MQAAQAAQIDQAWITLDQIARQKIRRQQVLTTVVDQVLLTCQQFEQQGLAPFCSAFETRDEFRGQSVSIIGINEVIDGVVIGIDDHGSLLLDTPTGPRKIVAGEVSLRQRV